MCVMCGVCVCAASGRVDLCAARVRACAQVCAYSCVSARTYVGLYVRVDVRARTLPFVFCYHLIAFSHHINPSVCVCERVAYYYLKNLQSTSCPVQTEKPLTAKYIHQVWQKELDEVVIVSNKLHEILPKLSDKLLPFCETRKEDTVFFK